MDKAQGLILPTVLIFLLIFSLLGISALTLSQLQLRMSQHALLAQKQLQTAETGLRLGEQNLTDGRCLIPLQNYPWQTTTDCVFTVQQLTGHYVIEQLPSPPDVYVVAMSRRHEHSEASVVKTALYYRITAWLTQEKKPIIILQSTFIKVGQPCNKGGKQVKVGRLAWREI